MVHMTGQIAPVNVNKNQLTSNLAHLLTELENNICVM